MVINWDGVIVVAGAVLAALILLAYYGAYIGPG